MSLTKQECENVLSETKIYLKNQMQKKERIRHSVYLLNTITYLFEKLIHEHFDNPPLKFEELEEGMWVWDNQLKEWRKVIEKLIVGVSEGSEFYEDIYVKGTKVIRIGLHKFDWKDILFESKRFYRKEVKE